MFLNLLFSNKKTVLIIAITAFVCYAIFNLFKKVDTTGSDGVLSNKQKRELEKNIVKLKAQKDSILQENTILLHKIHLDSLSMVSLRKQIQAKEVSVIRQEKNIKTIKDKYEKVYRLDSVSDDELVRLLSEQHIETSPNKKR